MQYNNQDEPFFPPANQQGINNKDYTHLQLQGTPETHTVNKH